MTKQPSPIRLPSRVGFIWLGTLALGWPLIAYGLWQVATTSRPARLPALVTISVMVVVLELLPVRVNLRHYASKIVISDAFVYTLMFVWSPWVAVVVRMVSSFCTDLQSRREWYKVAFNPALYASATVATSLVVSSFRGPVSLSEPLTAFRGADLPWIAASWLVWFMVNQGLVAGVVTGLIKYLTTTPRDFGHDTLFNLGVLAMSPLVITAALGHWYLIPLLVIPLLMLRWTGQVAIDREHEAAHDALTGLPNRAAVRRRLEQALDRERHPFALMLIDLDDFKTVNDTLGHAAGDALLVEVARRLAASVRPDDVVARLGGDEFAIIALRADEAGTATVADRVTAAFDTPVLVDGARLTVRLSVGAALHPTHGADATTLLRQSDIAMYRAKNLGTGVEVYSPDRPEAPYAGRSHRPAA